MLMVAEWAGRLGQVPRRGAPIIDDKGVAKMGTRFVESDLADPRPVIGI